MKKSILAIIPILMLAASSHGETVTVAGGATPGARTVISGVTANDNLILDSSAGGYYKTAGFTAKTVNVTNGEAAGFVTIANTINWDPSKGMTIDVNSLDNITAFTASSSSFNYCTTTFKNSALDSAAVVTIDSGTALNVAGGGSDQKQYLNFEGIKAKVYAQNSNIGNTANYSGETVLNIDEKSTVNWYGNINASGSAVDGIGGTVININGVLAMSDKDAAQATLFLKNGAVVNVGANGSLLMTNRAVNVGAGCTLNAAGNFYGAGGSIFTLDGTASLGKNATFFTVSTSGILTQAKDAGGIRVYRTTNFKSGANWTVDEKFGVGGNVVSGVDYSVTTAKLVMNEGSKLNIENDSDSTYIARVIMWGLAEITVKETNAISQANGDSVNLVTASTSDDTIYTNKIFLYKDQKFASLNASANLDVYIYDGAVLYFDGDGNTMIFANDKVMNVYDFVDYSIFIGTNSASKEGALAHINAYDSGMNLLSLGVTEDGWLFTVPEPADFAAVFGALALAFALRRRRS